MAKRLYVGNLVYSVTPADLRELFGQHGPVKSAQVVTDRDTGRSRGFGFVEMEDAADADEAIDRIDGTEYLGRRLNVYDAQPKPADGGRRGGADRPPG